MSFITGDVKRIIAVKLKPRADDLGDQYSRIFMFKLCLVAAMLVGFDYFRDTVDCIVPTSSQLSRSFIHSTCWIQGFYIYEQLADHMDESAYYGIPKDLDKDGIMKDKGMLCSMQQAGRSYMKNDKCVPMAKTYYMQYQYMPFYIAMMVVAFYAPYIAYRFVNADMISLKDDMKTADVNSNADFLLKSYFNYHINSVSKLRMTVVLNVFLKILYIVIYIVIFVFTDQLLHGRFKTYGVDWSRWAQKKMSERYDISNMTGPTPGNRLLPPMGFCEINEATKDARVSFMNKNKFICELSPHVMYQYVLFVLWFSFIIGIVISIMGLVRLVLNYSVMAFYKNKDNPVSRVFQVVTLREMEYLEYIQRKSVSAYADVLVKLRVQRQDALGNGDELNCLTNTESYT